MMFSCFFLFSLIHWLIMRLFPKPPVCVADRVPYQEPNKRNPVLPPYADRTTNRTTFLFLWSILQIWINALQIHYADFFMLHTLDYYINKIKYLPAKRVRGGNLLPGFESLSLRHMSSCPRFNLGLFYYEPVKIFRKGTAPRWCTRSLTENTATEPRKGYRFPATSNEGKPEWRE